MCVFFLDSSPLRISGGILRALAPTSCYLCPFSPMDILLPSDLPTLFQWSLGPVPPHFRVPTCRPCFCPSRRGVQTPRGSMITLIIHRLLRKCEESSIFQLCFPRFCGIHTMAPWPLDVCNFGVPRACQGDHNHRIQHSADNMFCKRIE